VYPTIASKLYIADTCKGYRIKTYSSSFQRGKFAYSFVFGIVVDTPNNCHTVADAIEPTYKHVKQYSDLATPTKLD
jgi:hypothetical protein